MARASTRPRLVLTDEEKKHLDQFRQSKTAAFRDVQRAQILWRYHAGETVSQIARALKMTRKSVLKWIDKTLQIGAKVGMKDTPHKPREAVITDDAKAWVVNLACSKPKEFGYAAELWTRSALARHVRQHAVEAGYPVLAKAAKATVQRILDAQTLRPHKVTYYLERRDPNFLSKMKDVLVVYQEVALQNEAVLNGASQPLVITVSVDEKPGVQAIGNTAPDFPRWPANTPRWPVIMSTFAMALGLFWQRWTCMTGTSPRASRSGTGARSSSRCSRIWTPIIRRIARFAWSWITTPVISRKRRARI